MTRPSKGTIPVDTVVVGRKMLPRAQNALIGKVETVIDQADLDTRSGSLDLRDRIVFDLVKPREFAQKRLHHPWLSIYSVRRLVDDFNDTVAHEGGPMNDFVTDTLLGPAEYEKVAKGLFRIGFPLSEEFAERSADERGNAIKGLLDLAGIAPEDSLRHWSDEDLPDEEDFWVPTLKVWTDSPAADAMLDDFTNQLTEATSSLTVGFYNVKSSMKVVDFPMASGTQPQAILGT